MCQRNVTMYSFACHLHRSVITCTEVQNLQKFIHYSAVLCFSIYHKQKNCSTKLLRAIHYILLCSSVGKLKFHVTFQLLTWKVFAEIIITLIKEV